MRTAGTGWQARCRRGLAALSAALSLASCAVPDPALRQAIADVQRQPEAARVKLRPYAERGERAAIGPICVAYGRSMDSRVETAERTQAHAWCAQAAAGGDAQAQYHLGLFLKSGIGGAEDRPAALQWFLRAAGQGHAGAEDEARALQGLPPRCRHLLTGCRLM